MEVLSRLRILILSFLWAIKAVDPRVSTLIKPDCSEMCGNVAIPFPFGIYSPGCYINPEFAVTCKATSDGIKPILKSTGMEVYGISLSGYVKVGNAAMSANCSGTKRKSTRGIDLSSTSLTYSSPHNMFIVTGCNSYAELVTNNSNGKVTVCFSNCENEFQTSGCYGFGCCKTVIPSYLNSFVTNMSSRGNLTGCRTAAIVDTEWFDGQTIFSFSRTIEAMKQQEIVPAVLQWGYEQGFCDLKNASFCSSNGYYWEEIDESHLCVCGADGYFNSNSNVTSGPIRYSTGGCRESDISSYFNHDTKRNCHLFCLTSSEINNCSCPTGYETYEGGICMKSSSKMHEARSRIKFVLIGCAIGIGLLLLLIGAWRLHKIIKRRQAMKLKEKNFKRNGGLLLQQQLGLSKNNIEQIKIFNSKELEKATDNFHMNRILGHGGQGTVYKGMLTNGTIVAIKKYKVVAENEVDEFINEVIILSQINHRNVVKLLGCCLEAEVPLLVYEFILNGTLYQHIHNPNEDFPIIWEMRLRISIEIANALSYLHSAASTPIYHRDIKSSNILLDDKYRAKVSDFGISKLTSIEQTHVTTGVKGTFGYLDPDYFRSSQFTEKSDVYSFGVVLIELLTGKKPVCTMRSDEEMSLVNYFLDWMEKGRLYEILDERVVQEASKEEIIAISNIAKRCLNSKGKERPTMKTVEMELQEIKASKEAASFAKRDDKDVDYEIDEGGPLPWDVSSHTSFITSSL